MDTQNPYTLEKVGVNKLEKPIYKFELMTLHRLMIFDSLFPETLYESQNATLFHQDYSLPILLAQNIYLRHGEFTICINDSVSSVSFSSLESTVSNPLPRT